MCQKQYPYLQSQDEFNNRFQVRERGKARLYSTKPVRVPKFAKLPSFAA